MGKDQEIIQEYFNKYYPKQKKYIYNEFVIETLSVLFLIAFVFLMLKVNPVGYSYVSDTISNDTSRKNLLNNIEQAIDKVEKSDIENKNDWIKKLKEYYDFIKNYNSNVKTLEENLSKLIEKKIITEEDSNRILKEVKEKEQIDEELKELKKIRENKNTPMEIVNILTEKIEELNKLKKSISKMNSTILALAKLTGFEFLYKILLMSEDKARKITTEVINASEDKIKKTVTEEKIKLSYEDKEDIKIILIDDSGDHELVIKDKKIYKNNKEILELTDDQITELLTDQILEIKKAEKSPTTISDTTTSDTTISPTTTSDTTTSDTTTSDTTTSDTTTSDTTISDTTISDTTISPTTISDTTTSDTTISPTTTSDTTTSDTTTSDTTTSDTTTSDTTISDTTTSDTTTDSVKSTKSKSFLDEIKSNQNSNNVKKLFKIDIKELNENKIKILKKSDNSDYFIRLYKRVFDENSIKTEFKIFKFEDAKDKLEFFLNNNLEMLEENFDKKLNNTKAIELYSGEINYNQKSQKISFKVKQNISIFNKVKQSLALYISGNIKEVPEGFTKYVRKNENGEIEFNFAKLEADKKDIRSIIKEIEKTLKNTSGTAALGTAALGTAALGTDTSGTDTSGTDTSGTDTSGTDTSGTAALGTAALGTDTSGTDTSGTDATTKVDSGTDATTKADLGTADLGTAALGTAASGTAASGTDATTKVDSGTSDSGTADLGTDATTKVDSGVYNKDTIEKINKKVLEKLNDKNFNKSLKQNIIITANNILLTEKDYGLYIIFKKGTPDNTFKIFEKSNSKIKIKKGNIDSDKFNLYEQVLINEIFGKKKDKLILSGTYKIEGNSIIFNIIKDNKEENNKKEDNKKDKIQKIDLKNTISLIKRHFERNADKRFISAINIQDKKINFVKTGEYEIQIFNFKDDQANFEIFGKEDIIFGEETPQFESIFSKLLPKKKIFDGKLQITDDSIIINNIKSTIEKKENKTKTKENNAKTKTKENNAKTKTEENNAKTKTEEDNKEDKIQKIDLKNTISFIKRHFERNADKRFISAINIQDKKINFVKTGEYEIQIFNFKDDQANFEIFGKEDIIFGEETPQFESIFSKLLPKKKIFDGKLQITDDSIIINNIKSTIEKKENKTKTKENNAETETKENNAKTKTEENNAKTETEENNANAETEMTTLEIDSSYAIKWGNFYLNEKIEVIRYDQKKVLLQFEHNKTKDNTNFNFWLITRYDEVLKDKNIYINNKKIDPRYGNYILLGKYVGLITKENLELASKNKKIKNEFLIFDETDFIIINDTKNFEINISIQEKKGITDFFKKEKKVLLEKKLIFKDTPKESLSDNFNLSLIYKNNLIHFEENENQPDEIKIKKELPSVEVGNVEDIKKLISIYTNRSNVYKINLQNNQIQKVTDFTSDELGDDCIVFYQKLKDEDSIKNNIFKGFLKIKNFEKIGDYYKTIKQYFEFNKDNKEIQKLITEAEGSYEDYMSAIPCKAKIVDDLEINKIVISNIEKGKISSKKAINKINKIKDNDLLKSIKEIVKNDIEVPEEEKQPTEKETPLEKTEEKPPEEVKEKEESPKKGVPTGDYFLPLKNIMSNNKKLLEEVKDNQGGIVFSKKKDNQYIGYLWIRKIDDIDNVINFSVLKRLREYFNISIEDYILYEAFDFNKYSSNFTSDNKLTVEIINGELNNIIQKGNLQRSIQDNLVKNKQALLKQQIGLEKDDPEYFNKKRDIYKKFKIDDLLKDTESTTKELINKGFIVSRSTNIISGAIYPFDTSIDKINSFYKNKDQYNLYYYIVVNDNYLYYPVNDELMVILSLIRTSKKIKYKNLTATVKLEDTNFIVDDYKFLKRITKSDINTLKQLRKDKIKNIDNVNFGLGTIKKKGNKDIFVFPKNPLLQPHIGKDNKTSNQKNEKEATMDSFNNKLDFVIIDEVFKNWKR
jgi:hypothetical protein